MPALIVTSGGDRYAIPQANRAGARPPGRRRRPHGIQMVRDAAVYRLRGAALPLVRLDAVLDAGSQPANRRPARNGGAANIVVLQVDDRKFGLIVDDVEDTQEIVVKPLAESAEGTVDIRRRDDHGRRPGDADSRRARDSPCTPTCCRSGATAAPSRGQRRWQPASATPGAPCSCSRATARRGWPCRCRTSCASNNSTARGVERSEGRDVVQYIGDIMPLVPLSACCRSVAVTARSARAQRTGRRYVIVYANGDRRIGLVVDRILDTIEHTLDDLRPATRRGTMGSIVIQGRVTEILDVERWAPPTRSPCRSSAGSAA